MLYATPPFSARVLPDQYRTPEDGGIGPMAAGEDQ